MSSDMSDKFSSLTSSQLQELRGVIKNPLGGRIVMIPLTSKAFVVGSLTPSKNDDGEEQILVRNKAGAELQTCLRKNVGDELENERQQRRDKAKAQKAKKSILKSNGTHAGQNVKKANTQPKDQSDTAAGPSLPYFEIKEEIDGAGKVVRAETINVTKQLELVANHAEGESKDDSNMDAKEDYDDEDFNDGDDDELQQVTEEPTSNSIPDEQEYSAISARLDELARMEEEAEATSAVNKLSALKLQSKGWSRGFLGGSAKGKKPVPQKQPAQQAKPMNEQKPSKPSVSSDTGKTAPNSIKQPSSSTPKVQAKDKGGWSKGFLNKDKAKSKNDTVKKKAPEVKDSSAEGEDHSKKVSFHQNVAEVREIPRVGNVSVASLKKAPSAPMPSSTDRTAVRPFDSTVFSGVVKERPIAAESQPQSQTEKPKKKLSKFAQERMENQEQPQAQTEQPKKRLSKFAQERMENR